MSTANPDRTPQTVLVVDDDDDLLQAIAESLREHGYGVVTATDGEAALALLGQGTVSLIVCDMSMPGMDGMAFVGVDKKTTLARTIPIVMMTGAARLDERPLGCVAVLPKPFAIDALLAIVGKHARR